MACALKKNQTAWSNVGDQVWCSDSPAKSWVLYSDPQDANKHSRFGFQWLPFLGLHSHFGVAKPPAPSHPSLPTPTLVELQALVELFQRQGPQQPAIGQLRPAICGLLVLLFEGRCGPVSGRPCRRGRFVVFPFWRKDLKQTFFWAKGPCFFRISDFTGSERKKQLDRVVGFPETFTIFWDFLYWTS